MRLGSVPSAEYPTKQSGEHPGEHPDLFDAVPGFEIFHQLVDGVAAEHPFEMAGFFFVDH